MSDDRPCTEGGKRHRVDERALEEARAEGGSVECLECGKTIPQGDPRDLRFRGEIA